MDSIATGATGGACSVAETLYGRNHIKNMVAWSPSLETSQNYLESRRRIEQTTVH